MRQKKNNMMANLNNPKIILTHDVILYYHFLRSETTTISLVEEPNNWVGEDFKVWREQICHLTITSYNASVASTNTTITPTGPIVVHDVKKAEDAWIKATSKRLLKQLNAIP